MYTPAGASGYFNSFGSSLPQNGQALSGGPGVASGTWRYYSLNHGRVHVVALDSMTLRSNTTTCAWGLDATVNATNAWGATTSSGASPTGSSPGYAAPSALPASVQGLFAAMGSPPQALWLQADLAAVAASTAIDFVVVIWHHPSYSDGSHKSDIEIEMIEMRQLYNPIIEAGGADIVMHGHSHVYERNLPLAGFTGLNAAFVNSSFPGNATFVATLTGGPAGTAQQVQNKAAGITPNSGTTYITAGSGGQLASVTASAATSRPGSFLGLYAAALSLDMTVGCALDFSGGSALLPATATLTCVNGSGAVVDQFQIVKAARSVAALPPPPLSKRSPPQPPPQKLPTPLRHPPPTHRPPPTSSHASPPLPIHHPPPAPSPHPVAPPPRFPK